MLRSARSSSVWADGVTIDHPDRREAAGARHHRGEAGAGEQEITLPPELVRTHRTLDMPGQRSIGRDPGTDEAGHQRKRRVPFHLLASPRERDRIHLRREAVPPGCPDRHAAMSRLIHAILQGRSHPIGIMPTPAR